MNTFLILTFILISLIILLNIFKCKKELELRVCYYDKTRVTLEYRFKNNLIWERLNKYYYCPSDRYYPYGHFLFPVLFPLDYTGKYKNIKEIYTKESIIEHNRIQQEKYNKTKREVLEAKKLAKQNKIRYL